jgi:hypothetical protein
MASVTADGACDTRKCHDAIAERGANAVIPPGKNAKPCKAITTGAVARNEAPRAFLRTDGRNALDMARDFDRQVAEFQVRVAVPNGFTALAIPVTKVAGQVCLGLRGARSSADLRNRA